MVTNTEQQQPWLYKWLRAGEYSGLCSLLLMAGSDRQQKLEIESEKWILDSLVMYLRGPIWNVPILNFIDEKSVSKWARNLKIGFVVGYCYWSAFKDCSLDGVVLKLHWSRL